MNYGSFFVSLLRISSLSKKYNLKDNKSKVILDNISIDFPDKGLVSIVGKSGSGKSTLLNMISLIDTPSNGNVYYKGEDINRWSEKRKRYYLNNDIGIVFQNYHLLDKMTAKFNVELPSLIYSRDKQKEEKLLEKRLKQLQISHDLLNKLCESLSGGEKERIALLRALSNNPRILICDEPTGSLDCKNSIEVMKILKQISKERLVIMVSHNEKLVSRYSDLILKISDGRIENSIGYQSPHEFQISEIFDIPNQNIKWVKTIAFKNFRKHLKRNVISIVSLVIGLVSSLLIIGFSYGHEKSIIESSYKQLDFGTISLTKEMVQDIPGSKISLVKVTRPDIEECERHPSIVEAFYIEPNTDTILPKYPNISVGENVLEDLSYRQVYSFEHNIDKSLLIKGVFPLNDNLYETVINKTAYEYLTKKGIDPFHVELSIYSEFEYRFYTDDISNPMLTDYFIFNKNVHIVGVVDDFSFLSTPKMFYPYLSLKKTLQESILNNQSNYLEQAINWYDLLLTSNNNDSITSYSYKLFIKNTDNIRNIESLIKSINKPLKIECESLTVRSSLLDLMRAASFGMEMFLIIALVGTVLLMGIISFSSYIEDKKTSAILTCLGAEKSKIILIFLIENIAIGAISLLICFIVSPLLCLLGNKLIESFTGFAGVILNVHQKIILFPFFIPLILIVLTIFICLLATYVPILFSKRISTKEELMAE